MKRTSIILLACVLTLLVAGTAMAADYYQADHKLKVTVPEETKLELAQAGETIDLGDITGAGTYLSDNSFTLTYRCNKKVDWQLKVEGTKFTSGDGEELPVSALNIKIEDGRNYNILSREVTIDSRADTGAKEKTIEFRYELQVDNFDDVYAGVYTNTVTYTLFVP